MPKIRRYPYLFLFIFSILAFGPIWFQLFSIKNDLLTGYFPVRFFFSESVNAGYIPWWNPYVNFGIPQHADMSGGFWNPVTWFISATVGYNIYTINLEALFYVLIGGFGSYKVGKLFSWPQEIRLIAAVSYMCCGYFIGNLQHLNWISGAGLLPFCYYFYMRILKQFNLRHLLANTFIFSLLITSSHPGILIGSLYFFGAVTGNHILKELKSNKTLKETLLKQKTILLILVFLLISNAALIVSYVEILPYITRDTKPAIHSYSYNATSFQSLISFMLPLATVKADSFYLSDIALRNCYVGLIPFTFVIFGIVTDAKKRTLNFFFLISLFFMFLSVGSSLQSKIYSWLPLINYVRLPAEFRIFALFSLILYGCNILNNHILSGEGKNSIRKTLILVVTFISTAFLFGIAKIYDSSESVIYHASYILNQDTLILKLKAFIDYLTIYDTVVIQGIFNIALLLCILYRTWFDNLKVLLLIAIADLFFSTLFQLPFTGYGKLSQSVIQKIVAMAPKGIPIPKLQPIIENDSGSKGIDSIVGNWSFYNKQPGNTQQVLYPIVFKREQYIYHEDSMSKIKNRPLIYFLEYGDEKYSDSSKSNLQILSFSPNSIRFSIYSTRPGNVIVQYKHYPHWKATVNNLPVHVTPYNKSFISIPIEKAGPGVVELKYEPASIRNIFFVQIFFLFLGFGLLLSTIIKRKH